MNFDSVVIAGGLPLGVLVSVVLSFLKERFKMSSAQARSVVAGCGLVYAVAIGLTKVPAPVESLEGWIALITNAIASGIALIFGSEGFYQWVSKQERRGAISQWDIYSDKPLKIVELEDNGEDDDLEEFETRPKKSKRR